MLKIIVMKNFDIFFFELLLITRFFIIPNESSNKSKRTSGIMANGWKSGVGGGVAHIADWEGIVEDSFKLKCSTPCHL